MKIFVIAFICLILVSPSIAQEYIEGRIQDEAKNAVGFCHVFNKTLNMGKVADMRGKFKLMVRKGDTLEFSYVGYQSLELVIKPVHMVNYVSITLPEDSILLPSITIYADPQYKVPIAVQGDPIFIPGVSKEGKLTPIKPGRIEAGTSPGVGGIPSGGFTLVGPITYFSKEEREKRKAAELFQETQETITYQKYIAQDSVRFRLCQMYGLDNDQYDQVIRRLHRQFPGIQKTYRPEVIWNWLLSHFDRTVPVIKQY